MRIRIPDPGRMRKHGSVSEEITIMTNFPRFYKQFAIISFNYCSPQNMSFQTPCSTKLGRNKPNLGRLSAFSISYAGSFIIKIFWKYIWLLLRCLKTTNNVFLSFRIRVYISQCQFADYQLSETLQNEVQEDFVRNESHQFNMPFF